MANVTLSIDNTVLVKAKEYAARQGTTLNAMVREFLDGLVDESGKKQLASARINGILSSLKLGKQKVTWTREELNER